MKIIKIEDNPFHEMPYRSSGRGKVNFNKLPFYFAYVDRLPKGVGTIIVTSDLQGRDIKDNEKLLGESFVEEVQTLEELEIIPCSSLLLSCGDLYDSPELNKLGATGNVTSVLNSFSEHFQSVFAVHGNHDIVTPSELSETVTVLDGFSKDVSDMRISGVCGIIGKPQKNQRKTESDFLNCLKMALRTKSHIIMLHQSPKDIINDQIGDKETAELLLKKGNSLVVSGHCHWEKHLTRIGDNQVLNVDSKVFVLIDKSE